ncbi:high affinity sulfate transporter 1 [Planoprotostelium fungivorum]|uniref:High affinity sulfate transporter 1 n=1 Tax=Planoprotostelium fungivorum TaxID=1890364 RepID=A0A2P6N7C7_9EUKA|nr:high affinity sulfate transporter 1 [Planoprotostelium fungivorum]
MSAIRRTLFAAETPVRENPSLGKGINSRATEDIIIDLNGIVAKSSKCQQVLRDASSQDRTKEALKALEDDLLASGELLDVKVTQGRLVLFYLHRCSSCRKWENVQSSELKGHTYMSHLSIKRPRSRDIDEQSNDSEDTILPSHDCLDRRPDEVPYAEVLAHRRNKYPRPSYGSRLASYGKRCLPLWIVRYQREWLMGDIIAGVTVGAVAVPQGIAYSTIVGLPPIHGLYSSLIPVLIYAFTGTSREIAIGPFSLVSLLTAEAVTLVCSMKDPDYLAYCLLLTFMVGMILTVAGLLKLGFLVNFMSNPVLEGFQCAAALVMASNQFLPLFGLPGKEGKTFYDIMHHFADQVHDLNVISLIIGLSMIFLLLVIRKLNEYLAKYKICIPAPLVVVIIGIILGFTVHLDEKGVMLVGHIPGGLPPLHNSLQKLQNFRGDFDNIKKLFEQAAILSLVTFMLTISVAKSYSEKRRYEVRSNQELFALGAANMVGSFLGCFPTAGSMSRTSINVTGGGRTQLSGITCACVVFVVLMLLTKVLSYLPIVCLAAIIIVSVIPMIQPMRFIEIWRTKPIDLLLCFISFFSTLFLGIANGIILSILASIINVIYSNSRPRIMILGRLPGTDSFHSVNRFPKALVIPGMTIIRMDASLFFANVNFFREKLFVLRHREHTRCIILDFEGVNDMDYTAATVFRTIAKDIKEHKILLLMAALKGPVRDVFHNSGLIPVLGSENILWEVRDAVKVGEKWMNETGILAEELHPFEEEHFQDWSEDEHQPLLEYSHRVFDHQEEKGSIFYSPTV